MGSFLCLSPWCVHLSVWNAEFFTEQFKGWPCKKLLYLCCAAFFIKGVEASLCSVTDFLFSNIHQLYSASHLSQLLSHRLHHVVKVRSLQHIAGVTFDRNPITQSLKANTHVYLSLAIAFSKLSRVMWYCIEILYILNITFGYCFSLLYLYVFTYNLCHETAIPHQPFI